VRRAWITVVVGGGVDLLIALFCVPISSWWVVASIVVLSSLPIITRSLVNEYRDELEMINAKQDPSSE
jgi:hypothetical protein